jgi:hypothetical protein
VIAGFVSLHNLAATPREQPLACRYEPGGANDRTISEKCLAARLIKAAAISGLSQHIDNRLCG